MLWIEGSKAEIINFDVLTIFILSIESEVYVFFKLNI